MRVVYLGLGANVGETKKHISQAIDLLGAKITNIKQASLYYSKAVGYTDQPDFINTALRGETGLSPEELFRFIKDIEKRVGRVKRFLWGPREIDIDILFYDEQVISTELVQVPHPRLVERDFVLLPLLELTPELVHPRLHMPIQEVYDQLPEKQRAVYKKD